MMESNFRKIEPKHADSQFDRPDLSLPKIDNGSYFQAVNPQFGMCKYTASSENHIKQLAKSIAMRQQSIIGHCADEKNNVHRSTTGQCVSYADRLSYLIGLKLLGFNRFQLYLLRETTLERYFLLRGSDCDFPLEYELVKVESREITLILEENFIQINTCVFVRSKSNEYGSQPEPFCKKFVPPAKHVGNKRFSACRNENARVVASIEGLNDEELGTREPNKASGL